MAQTLILLHLRFLGKLNLELEGGYPEGSRGRYLYMQPESVACVSDALGGGSSEDYLPWRSLA